MSEPIKRDAALVVLEEVLLAARQAGEHAQAEAGEFARGRKVAYHDVLTVAFEQAGLLDLDPAEFGMDGFDPDALLPARKVLE
jgi:hypothetical protein